MRNGYESLLAVDWEGKGCLELKKGRGFVCMYDTITRKRPSSSRTHQDLTTDIHHYQYRYFHYENLIYILELTGIPIKR